MGQLSAQITSKIVSTSLGEEEINVTSLDLKFIQTILTGILILPAQSYNNRMIEEWIRCQFKDYTLAIVTATHIYSETILSTTTTATATATGTASGTGITAGAAASAAITTTSSSSNPNTPRPDDSIHNAQPNSPLSCPSTTNTFSIPSSLQMNASAFHLKYKKFYESNLQRSMLLYEVDEIQNAYSQPWKGRKMASMTWTTSSGHIATAAGTTAVNTAMDTGSTTITANVGNSGNSSSSSHKSGGDSGNAPIDNTSLHSPSSRSRYGSDMSTSLHPDALPEDDDDDEVDHDDDYYLQKKNILRLQLEANLDPTDAASVFNELNESLTSESAVQIMLVCMPESLGGLHPLLSGLFSVNPQVRLHVLHIIEKINSYDSTKPVIDNMNNALKSAYARQLQKLENGQLEEQVKKYTQGIINKATALAVLNASVHSAASSTAGVGTPLREGGSSTGTGTTLGRSRSATLKEEIASYIDAFELLG